MSPSHIRPPTTFADILHRLPDLPGVRFTGRHKPTLELDWRSGGKRGLWARKAWTALNALSTYAQAKEQGFAGSFFHYCQQGRAGALSVHQVSLQESNTALTQWAQERIFPVPSEVDPRGRVLMTAHIRLGTRGVAPRLYFLDRTGSGQGVIVGWLGRHLTNTMTS